MSWIFLTALGVRPSPQVFSLGNVLRSTMATSCPWRASQYAAAAPAGPAPMTRASKVRGPTTAGQTFAAVLMPSSSSVDSPLSIASNLGAAGAHQSANSWA